MDAGEVQKAAFQQNLGTEEEGEVGSGQQHQSLEPLGWAVRQRAELNLGTTPGELSAAGSLLVPGRSLPITVTWDLPHLLRPTQTRRAGGRLLTGLSSECWQLRHSGQHHVWWLPLYWGMIPWKVPEESSVLCRVKQTGMWSPRAYQLFCFP